MSAQELVDSLAPMVAVVGAAAGGSGLAGSATHTPQQHVIIDIRSVEDSEDVGGGTMPRSIQLEPEFLDRPDALEGTIAVDHGRDIASLLPTNSQPLSPPIIHVAIANIILQIIE